MRDERDYTGWRRYTCAFLCFIECVLFSGLIYGWVPLVYIFKQEGVYADLCNDKTRLFMNDSNALLSVRMPSLLSNASCSNCSGTTEQSRVDKSSHVKCEAQDDRFSLVFTIGSTLFCASSPLIGQISLKCGTRITRIMSM